MLKVCIAPLKSHFKNLKLHGGHKNKIVSNLQFLSVIAIVECRLGTWTFTAESFTKVQENRFFQDKLLFRQISITIDVKI